MDEPPKLRDVRAAELLPGDVVLYESRAFLILSAGRDSGCYTDERKVTFYSSQTSKKLERLYTVFCPSAVLLRGGRIVY